MAFGIGWMEFVVIGIVAVMVFGPERLPRMIAQAAQWIRVVRAQATTARDDLMSAVDLDPALTRELRQSMSELAELNPRRMASSLLSDVAAPFQEAGGSAREAAKAPPSRGAPADYDDIT